MSIFNSFAALASGAGLEYEEGTKTLSATTTSEQTISFSNTHSDAPAITIMMNTGSQSTSYTCVAMGIIWGYLFGVGRGGSSTYYAQRMSGRGTNTSASFNNNYTSSSMTSYFTSSSVKLSCNSSYPFASGTWKWIAIWL